ncbi:hypothetical protein XENTR_v10018937 [Xenopus tropicalis]|uniref:Lysophosphatidic acid receptor 6 n=1 Tax=Xenopus tropicalis TaxID=8364 RepID=F6R5P2_XENTR|nr:lysophosphatidic acid receptor 6 [Xenopus tropicalis]KAE8592989.1 hypothetical protein XENTR_v10018937 [Xenopus tropicalis]KAE8592990.1 hypothetical protein XENTR_v10018937 [Xenopus tropicalis]|eukprot:XP_004916240.1 PREDICTED: lysophosphatidic acid receptor 6-like [Xenopus tropicalis]
MSGIINSTNSSEQCELQAEFQFGFFTVTYSLVFILGLPGNAIALYYLSQRKQRARSTNVYFLNLSVVDTVFICLLPFRIYYHNTGNNWVFGDIACRITGGLFYGNIYLSIGFFTCISLDRYLAVVHPLTYRRLRFSHYPLVLTILIWMICGAIVLPLIFGGPLNNILEANRTSCFEEFSPRSWHNRLVPYNVCALIFGFLVPFTVIAIVFPLMARKIGKIRKSIHRTVALRIIGFILTVSLICFLPYNITHLFHFLMRLQFIQKCSSSIIIYKLRRITLALISLNSCLNPLLYFIPSLSRSLKLPRSSRTKKVYMVSRKETFKPNVLSISQPLSVLPCQRENASITLVAKAEWSAL